MADEPCGTEATRAQDGERKGGYRNDAPWEGLMLLGFGVPLPVGRILVHVPVKRGHGGCFGRNVITPVMRRA